jgi:hypothetical protein
MNDFEIWFVTGLRHILDLQGYDHILFVSLLTVMFPLAEWKKLLFIVTAFTVGHSLTLALSVLNIIFVPQKYIELLIGITILVTSVSQLIPSKNTAKEGIFIYLIICFFGLIHGMGFSYLLRSMLAHHESVIWPLFLFNAGLEVGQLVIVSIILLLSLFLVRYFKIPFLIMQKSIAIIVLIFALTICCDRLINIFHS